LSGLSTRKASAVLIVVIAISLFQAAAFLTQPRRFTFEEAASGIGPEPTSSTQVSSVSGSSRVSNMTVTIPTTFPTTIPTTVLVSVSVTNVSTVAVQPQPDYTPIGIAIIVAAGILALVMMFMRRRR